MFVGSEKEDLDWRMSLPGGVLRCIALIELVVQGIDDLVKNVVHSAAMFPPDDYRQVYEILTAVENREVVVLWSKTLWEQIVQGESIDAIEEFIKNQVSFSS